MRDEGSMQSTSEKKDYNKNSKRTESNRMKKNDRQTIRENQSRKSKENTNKWDGTASEINQSCSEREKNIFEEKTGETTKQKYIKKKNSLSLSFPSKNLSDIFKHAVIFLFFPLFL